MYWKNEIVRISRHRCPMNLALMLWHFILFVYSICAGRMRRYVTSDESMVSLMEIIGDVMWRYLSPNLRSNVSDTRSFPDSEIPVHIYKVPCFRISSTGPDPWVRILIHIGLGPTRNASNAISYDIKSWPVAGAVQCGHLAAIDCTVLQWQSTFWISFQLE